MTCYMRHMAWLFADLGLATDPESQKLLDAALKRTLELPPDAQCPQVWAEVKEIDSAGWAEIMHDLRSNLGLPELD